MGLTGDVPASSWPPFTSTAYPVTAHQTLAHAGNRLLARPLDISGHLSSYRQYREELHICTGEDDQCLGRFPFNQIGLNILDKNSFLLFMGFIISSSFEWCEIQVCHEVT